MFSYNISVILCIFIVSTKCKKDPRDFTDADIYKLEEQWTEEGDIDEGDLPEHKRPAPKIDLSSIDTSDPEGVMKMTKKHKTLMMFATISGDPTEAETEELSGLWQSMLFNANIEITRFVISPNRILIKLADGSMAFEIKDFLVQQERCEGVSIDGQEFVGKGSPQYEGKKDAKKPNKKSVEKAKKEGGKSDKDKKKNDKKMKKDTKEKKNKDKKGKSDKAKNDKKIKKDTKEKKNKDKKGKSNKDKTNKNKNKDKSKKKEEL